MTYLQFIIAFDIILVGLVVLVVLINVCVDLITRNKKKSHITRDELDHLRLHDRTSIYYLPEHLRR